MADAKAEKTEAKEKKPLNLKAILMWGFVGINLGTMGLGAFLVYSSTLGYQHPSISEEDLYKERMQSAEFSSYEPKGALIYTMDKFTANLAGEPKRSIRVEVNLEMLNKDGFEEVIDPDNKARSRDQIIKILNDETFANLESIQGKLFLKDRIASEINSILKDGVVKDVYFSEFVVQ